MLLVRSRKGRHCRGYMTGWTISFSLLKLCATAENPIESYGYNNSQTNAFHSTHTYTHKIHSNEIFEMSTANTETTGIIKIFTLILFTLSKTMFLFLKTTNKRNSGLF